MDTEIWFWKKVVFSKFMFIKLDCEYFVYSDLPTFKTTKNICLSKGA